jgi:AcrR family transcriptional regulator
MTAPTTRDALIAAAADLLDQGGPAAVTLRAVAARVGISHNAPYKHFDDKQARLAAVAGAELRRRAASTRGGLRPDADPLAELKRLALGYVRWAMRHPARFKLTYGPWTIDSPELGEAAHEARALMVAAVAAAQAAGVVACGNPERVAALIQATGHGAADVALSGHLARGGKGDADPEDLLDDLFALLKPRP